MTNASHATAYQAQAFDQFSPIQQRYNNNASMDDETGISYEAAADFGSQVQ